MAGYNYNQGMSNNAVQAYANGEMPLSKWTKAEILKNFEKELNQYFIDYSSAKKNFPVIFEKKEELITDLKKLNKKELQSLLLDKSSYHHTSKFYNTTNFYRIDIEIALGNELYQDERFDKYYD